MIGRLLIAVVVVLICTISFVVTSTSNGGARSGSRSKVSWKLRLLMILFDSSFGSLACLVSEKFYFTYISPHAVGLVLINLS